MTTEAELMLIYCPEKGSGAAEGGGGGGGGGSRTRGQRLG